MSRAFVLAIGSIVLFATAYGLQLQQPVAQRVAAQLLGETWYRIELQTEHVGYMHNHAYRDSLGQWHFLSTTHILMGDNTPTTIAKHLVFGASHAAPLKFARYANTQNGQQLTTTVTQQPSGYQASLERSGQPRQLQLDWQFRLADFVALEVWLARQAPTAGAEKLARSPDFERLQVTQRPYRVLDHNQTGYLVENNAPLAPNRIQLGADFRPLELRMAGIFQMVATHEADAIALQNLRRKTTYQFPLDQRLDEHTNLLSLHLAVDSAASVVLPEELELSAGHVGSVDDGTAYSGEELRYPITHATVQKLVQLAKTHPEPTLGEQERGLALTLVPLTHRQLRYAEDQPAGSVTAALELGAGECTDYADLYTTLARAAGLPAKTVYGLAYKDGARPAFVFHAWNEVRVDGKWIAVDPTWNQTRIDAARIPLSDAQAANFMLAHNTQGVRFRVLDSAYF
ncbi:MAG: transglutaminase-like domain-containing protein [Pseudomonadota bacterium]